ncbi:hypothetical protein F5B22DRAFT_583794 [Xylaria bambusicola]|uniref:uncharacterized protein n=1 Tax=Xylaria bambusicola TaxID=326684 RepID=UPI002008DB93|nr:uncharacterized protein F5B22DRAFT_583794 [Xylaria bambusicola]KAI0528128.1 hypothetical protein F5B22DRAFT_583794 [Xylaria bambusicola]
MHSSFFSYPISRPYPQRWFTPVALVVSIVFAGLFSLVNLGSNGYYPRTIYTTDPNTTISTRSDKWFFKAPFNWDSTINPKCEPQFISVGDTFFSTNLGLSYQVASFSQLNEESNTTISLPSVLYYNNTLEDCHTLAVEIHLLKEGQATPPSWWISWRNSYAKATAQCSIMSESGPSNITLRVTYSSSQTRPYDDSIIYENFISDNITTHASMWWGSRLVEAALYGVMTTMSLLQTSDDNEIVSANLGYYWDDLRSPLKSIRDGDLFDLTFSFIDSAAHITNNFNVGFDSDQLWTLLNNDTIVFSSVLTEGLYFAKLIHSIFAVDLANTRLSSFLLDNDSLKYATSGSGDMNRLPGGVLYEGASNHIPGDILFGSIPYPTDRNRSILINESYSTIAPVTGPLETKNATIFTQYICSVPEQKSAGAMLLAILVADLVFLQATWVVLNWIAQAITKKQYPTAMACEYCLSSSDLASVNEKNRGRWGLYKRV